MPGFYKNYGKFKEALEDCNRILRLHPNHPEALVERAISRSAEAFQWSNEDAEDLRKAIAERPDYEKAWTNLANCLFGLDRLGHPQKPQFWHRHLFETPRHSGEFYFTHVAFSRFLRVPILSPTSLWTKP